MAAPVRTPLDAYRDAIKNQVPDKERREQIIDATKEAEEVMKAHQKRVEKASKSLIEMLQNYDATRDAFETFLDEQMKERQKTQSDFVAARFKARDLLSTDEWNAVQAEVKRKAEKD
jgi:hypothetical protein